jgi:hypothetical protein
VTPTPTRRAPARCSVPPRDGGAVRTRAGRDAYARAYVGARRPWLKPCGGDRLWLRHQARPGQREDSDLACRWGHAFCWRWAVRRTGRWVAWRRCGGRATWTGRALTGCCCTRRSARGPWCRRARAPTAAIT